MAQGYKCLRILYILFVGHAAVCWYVVYSMKGLLCVNILYTVCREWCVLVYCILYKYYRECCKVVNIILYIYTLLREC